MNSWYILPDHLPLDGTWCWIRIKPYYSQPFEAVYSLGKGGFFSLNGGLFFPTYMVARWANTSYVNGFVDSSFIFIDNWGYGVGWTFKDSTAFQENTAPSELSQSFSCLAGDHIRVAFNLYNAPYGTAFTFYNDANTYFLGPVLDTDIFPLTGFHVYDVIAALNCFYFNFKTGVGGVPFSLSDFSISVLHT